MSRDAIDLNSPTYTPGRLLDALMRPLKVRNDSQLARALEMTVPQVWRIRNRRNPITERFMVFVMDRTGWTVAYVRELGGIPFDGGIV